MNWLDYVILATLVLSTLVGVIRGVVREMFGLGTWVFAFVMAFYFADAAASALSGLIGDPALRVLTAYAGVFLAVLAIGAILTALLANWIRQTGLSAADRTLGGGFGLVRAVLLVGAGALLVDLAEAQDASWWQNSDLAGHFDIVRRAIAAMLPEAWLDALRPDPVDTSAPQT
ncbi:CvpA family protein [Polycyclovorans algicola]|uniref:CvpA family protein n=1 Tax=Polycyclovorans algicola TaxID=616992 RepID=UPI000693CA8D|nr:CvpA family protein [Polycyclovorans algicola]